MQGVGYGICLHDSVELADGDIPEGCSRNRCWQEENHAKEENHANGDGAAEAAVGGLIGCERTEEYCTVTARLVHHRSVHCLFH